MPLTVLAVAGGGFQGESLAQTIRAVPQARVIVLDTVADNLGRTFADLYLVAPPIAQAERFAAFLDAVIRKERVDLVLPCSNIVLKLLASLRERVEAAGARLCVCDAALLDVLLDKQRCYEALLEAAIPAQQPMTLSARAALPLYGKLRDGWGGRDTMVVRTQEELAALDFERLNRTHCWVPYLDSFEEFSVDLAIGFRAEVSPLTLRKRVRVSGGFAVISDSVSDGRVEAIAAEVARWMGQQGGRGLFNLQILRLDDDTFYVSDINPRHGTSSCHAAAEGNNLVGFLAGEPAAASRTPVRTVRSLQQKSMPLPGSRRWKGVVFDLDDTLIDHKRWMMDKMRAAAPALSQLVSPEALLRETYAIVEEGHHDRLIDLLAERLALSAFHDRLLEAYRAGAPEKAWLFPEVIDVLTSLRATGYRLGLLTDNPPASQRAKLATLPELHGLFDAVVFTREQGAEKPHAGGFLAVAEALQLPPDTLLMVGDNVARDAIGAVNARFDACLLLCRPGGRHQVNNELLRQFYPQVEARVWTCADLRALTVVCGNPLDS
ncbi:HAD-IA family hydrolase [Dyella japonica]|uniref:HAD-IA family hydrolase n=1 Tax=Dyella japonica TaxID=231455 RepID=UPI000699E1F3|nr:HAD-IA family hydrolase [Dyella japonica]